MASWKRDGFGGIYLSGSRASWKRSGMGDLSVNGVFMLYLSEGGGSMVTYPRRESESRRRSVRGCSIGQSSVLRGRQLLRTPSLGQAYVCIRRGHYPPGRWRRIQHVRRQSSQTLFLVPHRH